MEIKESSKKERKQIVFNVTAEDHEMIKCLAAKHRMTMRNWIINAIAKSIKYEKDTQITYR